ncbi:Uncharacterised protein [Chlamydia abortus]|nr:Uncharacterised protein [Chlamydia abortus]
MLVFYSFFSCLNLSPLHKSLSKLVLKCDLTGLAFLPGFIPIKNNWPDSEDDTITCEYPDQP